MMTEGRSLVDVFGPPAEPRVLTVSHQRWLFGIVKLILGCSVLCAFLLWQQALAG